MNEHLISVIIPVYNTAEYLPRCLDSILNNTYRELEVICVNDGSQDNSLEVLKGYAAKDSRVKVIDQENAGVSAARNHGLDEATGEYIAFVDSDDWVHRQYFEVLLAAVVNQKAHIAICGYTMLDSMTADPMLCAEQTEARSMTHAQVASADIPSWGRLYHRWCLETVRFDQGITLAEDTVFNLEILRTHPELQIVRCEAPMYYYFTRQNSLVRTLPNVKFAPLIRYYLGCINTFGNREVEITCLLQACKTLFLWRYRAMFQKDPAGDDLLRQLLKQACKELWQTEGVPSKDKLLYLTMARFPLAYRLFRILNDPTMLGWEKQQRQKSKAEKNKK